MVCNLHRLFQSEEDDRIMEGEVDPKDDPGERENKNSRSVSGLLIRLAELLFSKTWDEKTGRVSDG